MASLAFPAPIAKYAVSNPSQNLGLLKDQHLENQSPRIGQGILVDRMPYWVMLSKSKPNLSSSSRPSHLLAW